MQLSNNGQTVSLLLPSILRLLFTLHLFYAMISCAIEALSMLKNWLKSLICPHQHFDRNIKWRVVVESQAGRNSGEHLARMSMLSILALFSSSPHHGL